jgi:hypothetical protein
LSKANKFTAEDEDADGENAIDTSNIIWNGRRTRGKHIDFRKELAEHGDELDDDEDDDAEFVPKDDDVEMS